MEYQKIANLIDDTSSQPFKFRTKNWLEINDESTGKFKTTMLKSSLCDYSDAYILVKGKIAIAGAGNDAATRQAATRDLIISNDEMDDILKIVKSLEDSGVLLKSVSETIQHDAKEQRGGFLSMLLGTLGASLLGDVLSKGLSGREVIRAGEGTIRAGYGSKRALLNFF